MEYCSMGRTGVKVSPLCLGTMNFGTRTESAEATRIIDFALDQGINFIDSADRYGDRGPGGPGSSERMIGQALQQNGRRHRVVLATKFGGRLHPEEPNAFGLHRRHVIEACEASLERLQTDYIDLYQIHFADWRVPVDETLRALDDLVRAGKVRYLGASTWPAWRMVEALWVAKEYGLNRPVSVTAPYSLLDRRIERELIPMAQSYGLAVLPWSPLAGGFLTGKYERQKQPSQGRLSETWWSHWAYEKHPAAAFDLLDVLRDMADEKGCTVTQLALAWNHQQPGVTSTVVGPRTVDQLEENLGALDVEVTTEDRDRVDAAAPGGGFFIPYYLFSTEPNQYGW